MNLTSQDISNINDGFSKILINSFKQLNATDTRSLEGTIVIGDANFLDPVEFRIFFNGINAKGNINLDGHLTSTDQINITGSNGAAVQPDITLAGSISTPSQPIIINQNAVLVNNLELNTTFGNSPGVSLDFQNTLDGNFDLTLDTGNVGNIRFARDVGGKTALGKVKIDRANDVIIEGKFIAGDTRIQHSGDFTTGSNGSLDVTSLFINPDANSAILNGHVAGAKEKRTATKTDGPVGDPRFTINGCVIGIECDPIPVEAEPKTIISLPVYNKPPDAEISNNNSVVVIPNRSDTSNYLFNEELETDNPLTAKNDQSEPGDESEIIDEPENEEVKTSSYSSPFVPVVIQIRRPSYSPRTYQYSNFGNTELWDDIPGAYSNSSFSSAVFPLKLQEQ